VIWAGYLDVLPKKKKNARKSLIALYRSTILVIEKRQIIE
jgi:hypothetical protein